MRQFLDFEKPIAELENKIDELRQMSLPRTGAATGGASGTSEGGGLPIAEEVAKLEEKAERQLRTIYAKLSPWQKVEVARHAQRPHALQYIAALITDFMPLAGDRAFGDDAAVVGGLGRFEGRAVVVLGTERGSDLDTRLRHNFGMARPEGYRKAIRLIELAGRFGLPILTFVDTAGAFPGIDAEARGPAGAQPPAQPAPPPPLVPVEFLLIPVERQQARRGGGHASETPTVGRVPSCQALS